MEDTGIKKSSRPQSVEKALTGLLILSASLASLGSFSFGYNLSVVNTPAGTFYNCPVGSSVWSCFEVDKFSWGFVAGVLCVGALIGSLTTGWIADRVGRRKAIIYTNLPYILGLSTIVFAQNLTMLLIGRILVGLGVGSACIAVPLYLTEISTIPARGLIGSLHQLAIVVGFLAAEVAGFFGLYRPFYWRIMFSLDLIPCFLQILGMLLIAPESPRYLFISDRIDEGGIALAKLRGSHYSEDERNEIIQSCSTSHSEESWGLWELLVTRISESGKSMFVAVALHLGQQLSGINSILFFSSSIFTSTDEPTSVPLLIGLLNFAMTIFAILLIDRSGRRFLALCSSSVMFMSSVVLTVAFVMDWKMVSILAVLAFVGSFAFGLGPVPWLMITEVFPTFAVSSAASFAIAVNWISNLLVTVTFPILKEVLGPYAFVPYTVSLFLFFLFSWFILPETKGRPVDFLR